MAAMKLLSAARLSLAADLFSRSSCANLSVVIREARGFAALRRRLAMTVIKFCVSRHALAVAVPAA